MVATQRMLRAVREGARVLAVTALLTCATTPVFESAALAAPTAAEKETARTLVKDGRRKLRQGDPEGALDDFSAAHAIMNVPTTGREVGLAQMKLGRLLEARDTFLSVVRMPLGRREPTAFRAARKEAKELADKIAPRIPSVRITVTGDAATGAVVTVDGNRVSDESLGVAFKINPGEHEIVAQAGALEQRVTINIVEKETEDVSLELQTPPPPEPEDEDPTMMIIMASAFGLAGAAAVVGSVTGAVSIGGVSDVAVRCDLGRCPEETHGDLDAAETMGTVSTISFIVAGVAAVGGAVVLTLMLLPEEEPDVALGLDFTLGGASLRGRW